MEGFFHGNRFSWEEDFLPYNRELAYGRNYFYHKPFITIMVKNFYYITIQYEYCQYYADPWLSLTKNFNKIQKA